MRARSSLLLAAAAAIVMAASASAEDKVVNIYNWSDYIDPDVLTEFTDQTGIKVVYDVFDSNEIVETKLLGGSSGYDVVVPSASNVARQIQAGTLQPLDKSKIPNLSHIWPQIAKQLETYDPGNKYAANYMWGTTGIGYNVDKIKERMPDAPVDSWDMIFKPEVISKFADCGVHLLDSSDDLMPAALNYLGLEANSHKPDDLRKAADLLKTIRPYIQKFHSSEYINALANGDICMAVGYSGDVLQARDRADEADNGVHVGYTIPKEGALIWFDSFVIPKDAPHFDNAMAFINFMEDPEIAARNSNYVFYANGNIDSQQYLDDDVKNDPAIYPSQATLDKLYATTAYEPTVQRLVTRLWTDIKAGGN